MSLTGHNLRRRKLAEARKLNEEKKIDPVISEKVVEEKVEVKTETPSTTTVVHKKTTKKN